MTDDTNRDIWGEPTTEENAFHYEEETVAEGDTTTEAAEEVSEEASESEAPKEETPQMFTVKVNGEEKELTLDELTTNAQKGMDYDRIRAERDDYKNSLSDISMLAKEAGMSVKDYLKEVKRTIEDNKISEIADSYIQKGMEEETAKELARKDYELSRYKEQEAERNQQISEEEIRNNAINEDIRRFEELFGEKYTEEIDKSLKPYFDKGYRILEAYQQKKNDDLQVEIQNERNKQTTSGSVRSQKPIELDDKAIAALMGG